VESADPVFHLIVVCTCQNIYRKILILAQNITLLCQNKNFSLNILMSDDVADCTGLVSLCDTECFKIMKNKKWCANDLLRIC